MRGLPLKKKEILFMFERRGNLDLVGKSNLHQNKANLNGIAL